MKHLILTLAIMFSLNSLFAQQKSTIVLNKPDPERGLPLMKALSLRASAHEFGTKEVSISDLSDLLWAANGINRPEENKRTAASALNAQDIDIYVVIKEGIYFYDPVKNILQQAAKGDHRREIASSQENFAAVPLFLLLVSDLSRFSRGDDAKLLEMANIDAGIVAQNIMLFCASEGLLARPRAWMEKDKLREILQLKDKQHPILNIAISYKE